MNKIAFAYIALCAGACMADIPMREVVFPANEIPSENPRVERRGNTITHIEVFGPFNTQEDGSVKTTVIESAGDMSNASLSKFVESAQVRLSVLPKWKDIAASYSNAYVVAARMAELAQAKVQGEIEDLEAKIVKYQEYQTKYPLLKSVFAAFIADAQNRIRVLQALGGAGQ